MTVFELHVKDRKVAERIAVETFRKQSRKLGRVIGSQREGTGLPWYVAVVPFEPKRARKT